MSPQNRGTLAGYVTYALVMAAGVITAWLTDRRAGALGVWVTSAGAVVTSILVCYHVTKVAEAAEDER